MSSNSDTSTTKTMNMISNFQIIIRRFQQAHDGPPPQDQASPSGVMNRADLRRTKDACPTLGAIYRKYLGKIKSAFSDELLSDS